MLSLALAFFVVALLAALVPSVTIRGDGIAGTLKNDGLHYVAMATGGPSDAPAPFCYRVALPMLAKAMPGAPERTMPVLTLLALVCTFSGIFFTARQWGASWPAIGLTAAALASTQGVLQLVHNRYLTDAPAMLLSLWMWHAWRRKQHAFFILATVVGVLTRETTAPLVLLWLLGGKPRAFWVMAAVAGATLASVHALPGLPPALGLLELARDVWAKKGPWGVLGDALAAFHGLWLALGMGLALLAKEPRRALLPAFGIMLGVGAASSLIALNTVRLFALATPFVALAWASFFHALWLHSRGLSLALGALLLGGPLVWFPNVLIHHPPKALQWVLAGSATAMVLWAAAAICKAACGKPSPRTAQKA